MGPQPKKCHHCKAVDHLIAECPLREEKRLKINVTNGESNSNCKPSTEASEIGSEEDILIKSETGSSSSDKHLTDSGITQSTAKTPTTDDTKSETSATSVESRDRD